MAWQQRALLQATLRTTPILFLLVLSVLSTSLCHALELRNIATRAGFTHFSGVQQNTLLQTFGSVDTQEKFWLDLNGVNPNDVEFVQESSNIDCLFIQDSSNILTAVAGESRLNITAQLSFDRFVGETQYQLSARQKSTGTILASIDLSYTIGGITLYREPVPGTKIIVSGEDNSMSLTYEQAMKKKLVGANKILAFIQYPDGTTSDNLSTSADSVPLADSLSTTTSQYKAQIDHKATECDATAIGTYSDTTGLVLPAGCGYGFYRDESGNLAFGVAFSPYRAGTFDIEYLWEGMGSQIGEEAYETKLAISVTGSPPVVVTSVEPIGRVFRPEGGEYITFKFFNADLRVISDYQVVVENAAHPFQMVAGSLITNGAPQYNQQATFITAPGQGSELLWKLQYLIDSGSGELSVGDTAAVVYDDSVAYPGFSYNFSYDTEPLRIISITPDSGSEDGGEEATIRGHFPGFNPDLDDLMFAGSPLSRQYYKTYTDDTIVITLPPKSSMGPGYEFPVTVHMGAGSSDGSTIFSFLLSDAYLRVSQSGTSELDNGVFQVGDCTPLRFTALVEPLTKQIVSYTWSLVQETNTDVELLVTTSFEDVNPNVQSIGFLPEAVPIAGAYTLKVVVVMKGTTIERTISLMREHVVSVGAFILKPPTRTVHSPETPLRLAAVVEPPGSCYTGEHGMVFEWRAFGKNQTFSAADATGLTVGSDFVTTTARLGLEFVIPQEDLTTGVHVVEFKVWMADQTTELGVVSGQATETIVIKKAPLVPLIRYGESLITANSNSDLQLFATKSYDPDVLTGDRTADLIYLWQCHQAETNDFATSVDLKECEAGLNPSSDAAASFTIPSAVLESLTEANFIRYTLVVRKGENLISEPTELIVQIEDRGALPFLTDYSLSVENVQRTSQPLREVVYYEQVILDVSAPDGVSWTYEVIEPAQPSFLSGSNLIQNPAFYSPDALAISGNKKPLGIEAYKLDPFTTYKIRILFDASSEYEATSIILSIHTTENPVLGLPMPSAMNGTTDTKFTTTAGLPQVDDTYSYYFIITDASGNNFCIGGCTGYDVAYFRIGRPGEYTLTAYLYDMQGKALLDEKTLPEKITIVSSGTEATYRSELGTLFANGDDNSWTQMAHDLAIALLEESPAEASVAMMSGSSLRQIETRSDTKLDSATESAEPSDDDLPASSDSPETAAENLLTARIAASAEISSGSRRIFCNSFPNTYYGSDCMSLSTDIAKQPILELDSIYDLMTAVECCVKNTPMKTTNQMGPMFPHFLSELNRLSLNINQAGNSRRRLLAATGEPNNLLADLQGWTGSQLAAAVTSRKFEGFTTKVSIGDDGIYGHVSVAVASNVNQLPVHYVNGQRRQAVVGRSGNELFYAKDLCLQNLFEISGDEKRYFVLHTMDNFIMEGSFQDEPEGSNLADQLYWMQLFKQDENGRLVVVEFSQDDVCFCYRLPVLRKKEFLIESLDRMPGMFAVQDIKMFGVPAEGKGEVFNYLYENVKTGEHNATEGWVEACNNQLGIVGSTAVARIASNSLALDKAILLGQGAVAVVAMIVGGLVLIVVAMGASWMVATKSVGGGFVPAAETSPLYVERDVYGRGTIFDMNAITP